MRDAAVFLFVDARRPSSPCDTSGKKAMLAALTPTHCVRCCPFFRADRRWLSGKKGNAPSVLRLVSLPAVAFSMQIASLSGKIRNARCAHSNSLQRLRLQGREIRRNFSKTYTGLPLPVTVRKVNGQMVGFQTVTFQKPTISLKNIRLTCGDAGI